MTPATRQIVFINTAHTITHYSLLILPTAVLAMAVPGGAFGAGLRPDPGAGDGHVRAVRAAVAAAGLAGAALRTQGADDRVLLRHRRQPDRRRVCAVRPGCLPPPWPPPAGSPRSITRSARRCWSRRRATSPGESIGVNGVFGNLGVALAPVITAFLAQQIGWRAAFVAPGLLCVAAGLFWARTPLAHVEAHATAPAVSADPAPSGPPRGAGADADRDVVGPGVQRLHAAAAEADAGTAGGQRSPCCRWSARRRSW